MRCRMINNQFEKCAVCGKNKIYSLAYRDKDGKMVHVNGCTYFCDSDFKPSISMDGSNPVYKEKEKRIIDDE